MKKLSFFISLLLLFSSALFAQVGINADGSQPDNSAMLDVKSTDKGFLPPRMTTSQMNSIVTPPDGLIVYNLTANSLYWFNGSSGIWKRFNEFSYTETDPVFTAHPANGITAGNKTNWNTAYSNRITSASGTAPLTLVIAGNVLSGTIAAANTSTSGYLTSSDWNAFNNKVSSQWMANAAKLYYNAGNVGIGTTNPQSKIDIAGNAVIGSTYSGASAAPANGLLVEGKIGVGTNAPASSALVEMSSSNSGVLLPRITKSQRDAIANPANGLMVFCIDCGTDGSLSIFTNGAWKTFAPCNIQSPLSATHMISPGQITWNWNAVSWATGYKWSSSPEYAMATDMGASLSKTETGIGCNTTYSRYIWAYSGCGESGMTTLTQAVTPAAPVVPFAGTQVPAQTSVVWNWNSVANATGYKWSATNVFSTATDMGALTTTNETGLTCGVAYTRYVWAYNGCGNSSAGTLSVMTWACGTCGTLTINHLAGNVAAVTKTVTYGTVTNVPGEPSKCWITRNLGASQQASAANDNTEPSAGWYWQFNRKQGYKHDGTTRTPATTWISSINENSDWLPANDPCALELGNGWRLPVYSEWYNVDNIGNWTNWNGPWNSALKLHAAGYLGYSGGSLDNRGSDGGYWSSTQNDAADGWLLYFNSGDSDMYVNFKAYGFTARCLRD